MIFPNAPLLFFYLELTASDFSSYRKRVRLADRTTVEKYSGEPSYTVQLYPSLLYLYAFQPRRNYVHVSKIREIETRRVCGALRRPQSQRTADVHYRRQMTHTIAVYPYGNVPMCTPALIAA